MAEDQAQNAPGDDAAGPGGPRFTILTVGPGNSIYALFGHNAIWMRDPALAAAYPDPAVAEAVAREGVVFDFGTFDDRQSGFLWHYFKGDQNYLLTDRLMGRFLRDYATEGRWVVAQDLKLTPAEAQQLRASLLETYDRLGPWSDASPAGYPYRFQDDNCTTRIADWLAEVQPPPPALARWPAPHTRREALDLHLQAHPWKKTGIELLMAGHTDIPMAGPRAAFLPVLLRDQLAADTARVAPARVLVAPPGTPAGADTRILAAAPGAGFGQAPGDLGMPPPAWPTPLPTFALAAALVAVLTWRRRARPLPARPWADAALFLLLGLTGCLIAFFGLWSIHPELAGFNFNLLWLWPTHALLAAALLWFPRLARTYAKIAAAGVVVALGLWFFVPQRLPLPLFPLALLAGLRLARLGWAPVKTQAAGAGS